MTEDYEEIRNFYYALTDELEHAKYSPGWIRDVYPTQEYLTDSIGKGELYIGRCGTQIAAAMVVNHDCNEGYHRVHWSVHAEQSQMLVLHALGVRKDYSGRGLAKQMVQKAIDLAAQNGILVLRLDVLKGNLPAERLYKSMGFRYVDTLKMYYEDTGYTDYEVFERPVGFTVEKP